MLHLQQQNLFSSVMDGNVSGNSSGEDDGDSSWKAAIDSVTSTAISFNNSSAKTQVNEDEDDDEGARHKPQIPKHYQIKAQKLLDDMLGKSFEFITEPTLSLEEASATADSGVRLFKNAPRGIIFDHREEIQGPKKKPKLGRGEEMDEKSKKFKKQIKSVAVDGFDLLASAKAAREKSLARLESRELASRAAAKREEERLAELKKIRGERWLPSVAREMGLNIKYQKSGKIVCKR